MESKILTMRPDINSPSYGLRAFIEWAKFKINPKMMVEVGCYQGESTELFIQKFDLWMLFCVDPWKEGYDENDQASFSPMEEVKKRFFERMSLYKNCVAYEASSLQVASDTADGSMDLVYIDGDHRLEAVKQDIEAWIVKIRPGGIIAGHDYGDEVKEAVDKKFGEENVVSFSDSTWAVILP